MKGKFDDLRLEIETKSLNLVRSDSNPIPKNRQKESPDGA
jgi:hypothetical protein